MIPFREALQQRARERRRTIVFPEGDDDRTLEAVARLQIAGLVDPLVLGAPDRVHAAVRAFGGDPAGTAVTDHLEDPRFDTFAADLHRLRSARGWSEQEARARLRDPLVFAAALVRAGHAHGSVAGASRATADVLRAALQVVGTAAGIRTVSASFYMVVPAFRGTGAPEVLTFADAGVIPDPDARQLSEIAAAAAVARSHIVGDQPRVAFLSYSTHGSAGGPRARTMSEAAALFHERWPDIISDGELQADAALIEQVARRKAPGSPVGGRANVLVFPDLGAANIGYKLVQRLAGADAVGPILQGLSRPCNDLSRGASTQDIVDVACVTALQDGSAPNLPQVGRGPPDAQLEER